MVVTVPLFFLLGIGIQRYLVSRLRPENLTMMSVLLFFAIALSVEGAMGMLWTGSYRTVNVEYANRSQQVFGVSFPNDRLIAFAVAVTAFLVLWAFLRYSKWGRALRATVQHRDAAQLIGIDVDLTTAIGFGVGLATAAVAGSVLALITTIFPGAHWGYIARLMAIIVIGGLGSVPGAAIAALLMGMIEAIALVTMNAVWAALVFYIFLVATLLFRPEGFFGGRLAERF